MRWSGSGLFLQIYWDAPALAIRIIVFAPDSERWGSGRGSSGCTPPVVRPGVAARSCRRGAASGLGDFRRTGGGLPPSTLLAAWFACVRCRCQSRLWLRDLDSGGGGGSARLSRVPHRIRVMRLRQFTGSPAPPQGCAVPGPVTAALFGVLEGRGAAPTFDHTIRGYRTSGQRRRGSASPFGVFSIDRGVRRPRRR
jgi:hypothetical protein